MKSCEECKRLKKQLKYARKETDKFARLYMKQREFAKKLDEQFIGVMVTVCGDLQDSNAGDDVKSNTKVLVPRAPRGNEHTVVGILNQKGEK